MNQIKLKYKYDDERQDTAEVWIEGFVDNTPQRFILDTGCATTSLYLNEFSEKYISQGSRQYSGTFGSAICEFINVSKIGCGPIQKKDITIVRTQAGGNDKNLFGMDLLKDHIFHFLPKHQVVEILTELPPDNYKFNPLFLDSGSIPFIELEFFNQTAIAVWDTGAGVTIVDRAFLKRNSEFFDLDGITTGTDSTGRTFETETFLMKSIWIGHNLFPPHRVVPIDLSHIGSKTGRGMDFILGFSTLRLANWLMDFQGRKWTISKALF